MSPRRLTIEPLENRVLLAGNVTAELKSGELLVTGDNQDNQIQIADLGASGAHTYRVTGLDGTVIVGGTQVLKSGSGLRMFRTSPRAFRST